MDTRNCSATTSELLGLLESAVNAKCRCALIIYLPDGGRGESTLLLHTNAITSAEVAQMRKLLDTHTPPDPE